MYWDLRVSATLRFSYCWHRRMKEESSGSHWHGHYVGLLIHVISSDWKDSMRIKWVAIEWLHGTRRPWERPDAIIGLHGIYIGNTLIMKSGSDKKKSTVKVLENPISFPKILTKKLKRPPLKYFRNALKKIVQKSNRIQNFWKKAQSEHQYTAYNLVWECTGLDWDTIRIS
jgi:hypothetical protein